MTNKLTIDEMREIAKSKGGKCLSTEYINNSTKLVWKCSEGHTWMATPKEIKKRTWCPFCAKNKLVERNKKNKHNIQYMCDFAWRKGGMCLSNKYTNLTTKLTWQCAEGHSWTATPLNILYHNSWCPTCSKMKNKREQ